MVLDGGGCDARALPAAGEALIRAHFWGLESTNLHVRYHPHVYESKPTWILSIQFLLSPEDLSSSGECDVNAHGSTSRVLECNVFCHGKGPLVMVKVWVGLRGNNIVTQHQF